jgi:hypothetical protein
MGTNLLGELVANNGTFIVNTIGEYFTKKFDALIVLEDTIIDDLLIEEISVLPEYVSNVSIPLKAGTRITALNDKQFMQIYLASGSVELVLSA